VEGVVEGTLDRFGDRIIRVEVHLNDLNSHKLGYRDKRCLMEAHIAGHEPIAVSHEAATLTEAIHAAADKLKRALDHVLGRIRETPGRTPLQDQIATVEELEQLERSESAGR
jgi:ribosome-associated translation inhibitor RaiA